MKKKAELLAPAGSFDVMKACIAAGADAVYMGLSKFSARAYADNAADETYVEAINFAHLHGAKLYLTINTLFKEKELFSELFDTLKPLYEAGLDAVIVQDVGAMRFVHECFPGLPIHASTQATVTGPGAVKFFQELGVKRTVPARELSLKELRHIKEETGTELECFIHGALCYSYSGQCLFSSIVGGRSGNRGRCAQPCRMNYAVKDLQGRYVSKKKEGYVLSLKDLNTLAFLPDLLDAGIYSLKIEGRMKKAEYAAGVTSIYRKYLDLYFREGRKGYRVDFEDEKRLFSLFNRKGFSKGYYEKQNGREMLTLTEPDFREEDTAFTNEIRKNYIENGHKVPVRGIYSFPFNEPYSLKLTCTLDDQEFSIDYSSETPALPAEKRAATKEDVEKQLRKLGDTGFMFESLEGTLSEGLFLPVSALNDFRRNAVKKLEEEILRSYRRILEIDASSAFELQKSAEKKASVFSQKHLQLSALVRTEAQLREALDSSYISTVILESTLCEAEKYESHIASIHNASKKAYLALPRVWRDRAESFFSTQAEALKTAKFDGFLIRSLEEKEFLEKNKIPGEFVSDHNLYAFNTLSEKEYLERGFQRLTVPVELNGKEIRNTGFSGSEMILYGRLPMMVSSNCIHRTTEGCDGKPKELLLIDRMGNEMPVLNECRYCLNTIFNALPLSLLDSGKEVEELGLSEGRLEFSTESGKETAAVIRAFGRVCIDHEESALDIPFTRGHFRRGVE